MGPSSTATSTAARRRPTIEDVARAAGVSRGTVSRALNGGPVSPRAREQVDTAIRATGYSANMAARSLASGRTGIIAAVLSEPYGEVFEDPTFGVMLQGVAAALAPTDASLNLLIVTSADERARAARQLHPGRVDGMILLSPHVEEPLLAHLSPQLPVVVCGELTTDRPLTWSVTIDDEEGGRQGASHLLAAGARRIAVIGGPVDAVGAGQRIAGQREVLGERFDPRLLERAAYSTSGGAAAMRALLARAPDLDGVLCASDRQALGALNALRGADLRVPEDVRLIGFDDHRIAQEITPPLTTIHQPIAEIGRRAAQILEMHLRGGTPAVSTVLPTHLVVRGSA